MVLPVLGLLAGAVGLGSAAALSPHYRSYNEGVRGRRFDKMAARHGFDPATATPREMATFGLKTGMLSLDQATGVAEGQRDFDRNVFENDRAFGQAQQQIDFNQNLDRFKLMNFGDGQVLGGDGQTVDFASAGDALSHLESGGNYAAVGPRIDNPDSSVFGQQALGKYQVMEGNAVRWAKEAGFGDITPEQFLQNPDMQEAVFQHKFGEYVEKYGLREAIVKWHAGEGKTYNDIRNGALNDGNMSTLQYVQNIESQYLRNAQKAERGRVMADMEATNPAAFEIMNDPTAPAIRKQQAYEAHVQRMQAQVQQQQGVHAPTNEAIAAAQEANKPLVHAANRISDIFEIMPEGIAGKRWGNWFADNDNAVSAQRMTMMHAEVRQQWIDQMMQGREPSDAVRDELAAAFPASPNAFTNSERYKTFMQARQQELVNLQRRNLGLPEIDYSSQTVDGQEVIPDG